jgi:hypothetical protein
VAQNEENIKLLKKFGGKPSVIIGGSSVAPSDPKYPKP